MKQYYIWYNSEEAKYFYGTQTEFLEVSTKQNDSLIIAEEFAHLSQDFARKITHKLNENLSISGMRFG